MATRAALPVLVCLALSAACERGQAAQPAMRIIAHRGASGLAPENTVAAVRAAWQVGAHGVEIDVRLSADGVPMVIHDEWTGRVAGIDLQVAAKTRAQLGQLRVRGERIPTLAEVVAEVPAGKLLVVEIKSGVGSVAAVLAVLPDDDRFAFQSFEIDVLLAVKQSRPRAQLFWTIGTHQGPDGQRLPVPTSVVAEAIDHGVHGLAVDLRGVTAEFRSAVASAGLQLDVWTVNDPATARALRDAGDVRWLETDHPGAVVRGLAK